MVPLRNRAIPTAKHGSSGRDSPDVVLIRTRRRTGHIPRLRRRVHILHHHNNHAAPLWQIWPEPRLWPRMGKEAEARLRRLRFGGKLRQDIHSPADVPGRAPAILLHRQLGQHIIGVLQPDHHSERDLPAAIPERHFQGERQRGRLLLPGELPEHDAL